MTNKPIITKYGCDPVDFKRYSTADIRERFLLKSLFLKNEVILTYFQPDRMIFGGIMPCDGKLAIPSSNLTGTDFFLQRREAGVINIGGPGIVTVDGKDFALARLDGIYIGAGSKDVVFASESASDPAKFYIASCPAHAAKPSVMVSVAGTEKTELGSKADCNQRTISKYIHPAGISSCQLVMGMTRLQEGSIWNTMPCHTHDRRMEVYMYFDMKPGVNVFHLMGQPDETRHIVVRNEQAVISPSWSIHSGAGTSNYCFIWAMCGENQVFTDMDAVDSNKIA